MDSAISLGYSIPDSKWSHSWQIVTTISALNKSLNKSLKQYLIIGLFYFFYYYVTSVLIQRGKLGARDRLEYKKIQGEDDQETYKRLFP